MSRRYGIVLADPPWRYRSLNRGRGGAEDHYPTMALEDIKSIRVPAADDCALFVWATMPLLREAFAVIQAWGFTYKTVAFCWVKQNTSGVGLFTGLGFWTRANVEVCLLATCGRPRPASHRARSPGWDAWGDEVESSIELSVRSRADGEQSELHRRCAGA